MDVRKPGRMWVVPPLFYGALPGQLFRVTLVILSLGCWEDNLVFPNSKSSPAHSAQRTSRKLFSVSLIKTLQRPLSVVAKGQLLRDIIRFSPTLSQSTAVHSLVGTHPLSLRASAQPS